MCLVSIPTSYKLLANKSILGTGHYLSPAGVGGRGGEGSVDFCENPSWVLSRNWEPKRGGSLKTFEGFGGGTTQICLENEGMVEGSRKSSKVIRGGHFTEETFKGGIG